MPRFLIETDAVPCSLIDAATRVAAIRFPEISVEPSTHRDGGRGRTVWVCGAPSRTHLQRWARAVQLRTLLVRPIESTRVPETNAGKEQR